MASRLTPATLRGAWTMVFLGFTHCPDVCPTTLAELAQGAEILGNDAGVDPAARAVRFGGSRARHPRQHSASTRHFFHADTLAATGDPAALAEFAQVLGLVYMKVPLDNGDYSMDHSATLVVLDPQGRQAGLIRPPLVWTDIASDLRLLAEGGR